LIISVASGKGGTGKTLISTSLALALGKNVQFLDCDVEEPNAHIFLKPEISKIEPVSVLIADFDNLTGDEVFDGVLEQALAIGLEEASFISSYRRGEARQVAQQILGEESPLDIEVARLVAQREAVSIVVSGSIETAREGYRVEVEALDGVTGESIALQDTEVTVRDQVLPAMARLGVVGVGGYRRLPRWVRRASVAAGPAKVQTAKRRLNGGIVARSRITEMRRFRPAPTMA